MALELEALLDELPEDPHEGSYVLFSRIEKNLKSRSDENELSEACGILGAYYEAVGFKIPDPISPRASFGSRQTEESFDEAIERVRMRWKLQFEAYRNQIMANNAHVIRRKTKDALDAKLDNSIGYAVLTAEEKEECHIHINNIRKIVEESDLDDRKKNNLFIHLATLVREVDRNGTRTDRFFAFASDAGFVMGDFAKKAKPLIREIKEILKIITKSRAKKEGSQLPPGDEVLRLPSPQGESAE